MQRSVKGEVVSSRSNAWSLLSSGGGGQASGNFDASRQARLRVRPLAAALTNCPR